MGGVNEKVFEVRPSGTVENALLVRKTKITFVIDA